MFELPFVFGLPHILNGNTQWNALDKKMSESMMALISQFARTGNPTMNAIKWEPFTEMDPGVLLIERNLEMSGPDSIDYKALAFWNEYYPTLLDAATNNCCNVTSSATKTINSYRTSFTVEIIFVTIIWQVVYYQT